VDVLRDQARDLGGRIANHVQQGYDIRASGQVLENFDFSLDLLLLNGLEDFNYTLFIVENVNALEDLFRRGCRSADMFLVYDRHELCPPLSTFRALLSERSRNDLGIPTGPVDYLPERYQKQEERVKREERNRPYSCQEGPSFPLTSA
jgi:hypothetical protein